MKKTGYSRYIYQNELDKTCFEHDVVYRDFSDFFRRTGDTVFDISTNPKYDGYQYGFVSMIHKFFDKISSGGAVSLCVKL